LDKGQFATRKAYGVALQALGHANPHVVALDGDVRNSTYSENFLHDQALAERFFECRIAEQHMVSCAGGLAAGAKVPFVSTFGKFIVRSYDQVEMGLISRFNLKLIGSHTGVSLAADGPSQMALPDVAFFRAWSTVRTDQGAPLLYLLQPADAYAAYALTVEDNYGAGIGSAVADALTAHGGTYTLAQMFVRQIPKSGRTPEDVLRFLHLSADDIVATGMRLVEVVV
jgi:transketolase